MNAMRLGGVLLVAGAFIAATGARPAAAEITNITFKTTNRKAGFL